MITGGTLEVLGSGGSSGVPVIGCACETCCSDDPRDVRLRTSAVLRFTDPGGHARAFLIDTSPDLRLQALRAKMQRCDAIFYTHHHVDHTFGLDEVRRFNIVMDDAVELFANDETLQFLSRTYRHIFDRAPAAGSFVASLRVHRVVPPTVIDRFGVRATPIPLLHAGVQILGWRFDVLDEGGIVMRDPPAPFPIAWCTDVSGIPPESWPLLNGLRTLAIGMLRYRRHPGHYSVDEAVDVAARIAAMRTIFVHMTHDIRHADLDPRLPEAMELAWDGLVIDANGDQTEDTVTEGTEFPTVEPRARRGW